MTKQQSLFYIAESQNGFFTAYQAVKAGIQRNNHSYYVRTGHWIREWRGVYRLHQYPPQDDWQYSLWGVWSINRKDTMLGVYSYETALSIHGLSDVNPAKLHMIVPRGFRRHSKIPPVLSLHFSNIDKTEYTEHFGYKVAKPGRAIADLIRGYRLSPEFIIQAIKEGIQTGKLTKQEYQTLLKTPRVGKPLEKIMAGHHVT
jgi:predicted transcriptional regulator of viral defense system